MGILECIKKAERGQIVIDIPAQFEGKNLRVVVTEEDDLNEDDLKKFHELPVEDRIRILNRFAGSAKYPDFPIDKYDVYDQ